MSAEDTENQVAPTTDGLGGALEAHSGVHAVRVAAAHGVDTMFTLSGAHVFPMYDGAVNAEPAMRLLDVRHEQTAVFAAEAVGKLTRKPGLAVLTAGPGITNGVSPITQAYFSGAPLVVIGGRAPGNRWGSGSLQELDHVPLVSTVTKSAATVHDAADIVAAVDHAFASAKAPHRGPAFLDVAMDAFFASSTSEPFSVTPIEPMSPDAEALNDVGALLAVSERPVLIIGGDVWADGAEAVALEVAEHLSIPVITNGMGRGVLPRGHRLLATKARSVCLNSADLVIVIGTPLDFRLGYGVFGGKDGAQPAKVVHLADSESQLSLHATLSASAYGDLSQILRGVAEAFDNQLRRNDWTAWVDTLAEAVATTAATEAGILTSQATPIHPGRIYGELIPRLDEDAVVIGDGGDFVSFAGKLIEPMRPGCWLDPGPYGCLGAGLGAAIGARISRPTSQVVLLLGDGAAGMSLMDVDTLVRHNLPVVMVMGNNSAWALEKGPMQMLYGYDVIADLAPRTRYDEVVTALGGAGEMVTDPEDIGPALDRAFAAGVPYLVNIITDVEAVYPRVTFGI